MTASMMRWRVHWVICEFDARGEIDSHAAMCLRHAIDAARPATTEMVLIDLRDLTAIDTGTPALFATHNANCHARGMDLGLLISGHERHDQIAEAFVLGGLGDTLHYTREPRVPATAQAVVRLDHARVVPRGRLARAARRFSPRLPRRAPDLVPPEARS